MMRKIFILISVIIFLREITLAQVNYDKNFLDSLYNYYVSLRSQVAFPEGISNKNPTDIKCGFGLSSEIKHNFERFTLEQQNVLMKLLQRPSKQASMVSSSGFFRIHYDTTGFEVPNYNPALTTEANVTEVAEALDSTYNFEVIFLGYPPPPQDNNVGSDNLYDVYITIPIYDSYGSTAPESFLGDQKYTSYMEIHYDFKNFYTKGLNAMRVTVAHEFHHSIQLGNYTGDKADIDLFFYEMTSTSMEEFVYDDVNDYYAYMPSYFLNPQKSFAENTGYSLAIWNIYLKENFGFNIVKRQWELMPTQRAMNAINTSLTEAGSSFKYELNKFGEWTYYTKHRAIPGEYFEEASFYPLIRPLAKIIFTSTDEVVSITSKATANNFIYFTNQTNNNDTMFVLITNGDVLSAITNSSQLFPCTLYMYDYYVDGAVQLKEKYYAKLETENPSVWLLFGEDKGNSVNYPFPQPFSYAKNYQQGPFIIIPVSPYDNRNVDFYVYSSSMNLIYSEENYQPTLSRIIGGYSINWKVLDNQRRKLASGVYIYVIKSGDEIQKGKLVILHD